MKFSALLCTLTLTACGVANDASHNDASPPEAQRSTACISPRVVHHGAACSIPGQKQTGEISYVPTQFGADAYVSCTCEGSSWVCPSSDEVRYTRACADDSPIGTGSECAVEGSKCVGSDDWTKQLSPYHIAMCTCQSGRLVCSRPACD